jgi:hypothetical protein
MDGHPCRARSWPGPAGAALPADLNAVGGRHAGQELGFARLSPGFGPVLLIPDGARPMPGPFRPFFTGYALLRFLEDAAGFCLSSPDGLSEEHKCLVSALFDDLGDWINASRDLKSIHAGRRVALALTEQIKDLARAGLALVARERFLLLTGGVDPEPLSWRIIYIEIQPDGSDLRCL